MASYDIHYQKEDYFGKPYPELIAYMSSLDRQSNVLDLGCGQGRDAIAIGRLGFSVTGVDISSVGINQMLEVVVKEQLDVKGIVSDLNDFDRLEDFDIILLDSMFHFYKRDVKRETAMLNQILTQAKITAHVLIIVQEKQERIDIIKDIIATVDLPYIIEHEEGFLYQEFNSRFYMIDAKRVG